MATITTRAGKGAPLTNTEVDDNFTNLNTDKAEAGDNSDISSLSGITGGVGTADYVDFDTAASVSRSTGRIKWNDADGTLEIGLKGSEVSLQLGQEVLLRAYNNETTDISNGEAVYIQSSSNGNVAVKRAIADGSVDYEQTIGVATESISAGGYGYVCFGGLVRGVNTSEYSVGDSLYVSETTAGAFRVSHPASPNVPMHIGMVVDVNATEGVLFIDTWTHTPADESVYDNSDSELTATNVKGALDELSLNKADISLLSSNITAYPTTASADVTNYYRLVTSVSDDDFDDTAVDVVTPSITDDSDVLCGSLVSDAGIFAGDIAGINVTIVGNVKRASGNDEGEFKFEVYHRDNLGTETIIGTSGYTDGIDNEEYTQLFASAYLSSQTFTETCRLVLKFYGKLTSGAGSSTYHFQYGGTEPVRALFPVPVSVVPTNNDADNIQTDTATFNGKLSGANTNVQSALETLDDHGHVISEISGLQSALDAKANTSSLGDLATKDSVSDADIDANSVGASELKVTGNGTTGQYLKSDTDGTFSWDTPPNDNTTYTAGSGLGLSGTQFSHADTSTQGSVNNSSGNVIQDITLDGFGHITGLGTVNLDGRYYTETESDNRYLKLSGGTMTGRLALKQHPVSVSTASTVIDFSQSNDFKVTMGASTSFLFQNMVAGQSGILYIVQDATGGWTFTLPAIAKTPKNGANIAQETGAGVISILSYVVLDTSNVLVNYIGDFA